MGEPAVPDADTREQLLAVLGEFVGTCGAGSLLMPPVAPGTAAFPEPWARTPAGVRLLLRRLLWHAGIDREVVLDDQRTAGAPPTERKPTTRVELVEVHRDAAHFTLGFIGTDDVAGTLAHEVGTLHAAMHRPDDHDPYRTAKPPTVTVDPDLDPQRGGVATVYLGLGVLAANAAYQQYTRPGRFNGGYVPHEYDVVRAGELPMSALAFLLAVQAIVRGEEAPPKGLSPPQRDEVAEWMKALAAQRAQLCERLGVPIGVASAPRPDVIVFEDVEPVAEAVPRRVAFRWQTNRGGVGLFAGAVAGVGIAFALSRGMAPFIAIGGATAGHVIGRRVRTPRCSACASVVPPSATSCRKCGALLRGEIAHLSERLEAEERLEEESPERL